jgi:hypothetical protein
MLEMTRDVRTSLPAYKGLPAGWEPDPTGRHQLRYWDGSRWTDSVEDFGVISDDPLVPPPVVRATNGEGVAAPEVAYVLVDTVEDLVFRLRNIARKDRHVGTDFELSELAVDAVRQARTLRAELARFSAGGAPDSERRRTPIAELPGTR